jgi:alkaline phosphatase D
MILTTLCLIASAQVHIDWNTVPDQYWIGQDWHANRLQDWQVDNHRIICTEVAERLPMRTLHLLTSRPTGDFELQVLTGTIENETKANINAWSGFLIGVGNNEIDYRLSALTHHVPATNGGYIAGVDHLGKVFLRNNNIPVGGTSLWSISKKIQPNDVPSLTPLETSGSGFDKNRTAVLLHVSKTSDGLILTAKDPSTNEVLHQATYDTVLSQASGVALVSHHGPLKSKVGHWFDNFSLTGTEIVSYPSRALGPVISTLYTVHEHKLKLTAQFPPLDKPRTAKLILADYEVHAPINTDSWTATFFIPNWNTAAHTPYEVFLDGHSNGYKGIIKKVPAPDKPIQVAALTCHKTYTGNLQWNENGLWFPQADITNAVSAKDVDLVYFSGDQIYEGDLTPAHQKNEDAYILDYLYKWNHWCWAFQELTRNTPCITIPDDHDVYHGNLWGAGERDAQKVDGLSAQDSGGYKMSPRFVNTVHRTQTSHLPDPIDQALDAQGNTVYFTRLRYGGLDIAILGDRQFKESPAIAVPDGGVYNGWFKAEGFDPKTQSDCDAPLLGSRQEAFLERWSTDWQECDWMKLVFSQSPFVCLQTLPEGTFGGHQAGLTIYAEGESAPNDVPVADADSNGWPQTARNRTLRLIKKANAIHVCGDQHLGSVAQYGIDEFGDGTYVFCTPAIANTWPRRWMPKGKPITGDHKDGFGNKVTVLAVSNPHLSGHEPSALHDRAPGWGLLLCDPQTNSVKINAWPRWAKPNAPDNDQYNGWPVTLKQIGKNMPAVLGISPDELKQLLKDESVVLIDVREVDEFQSVRIQGALNYPMSTFSIEEIQKIANGREIVFHCHSGYRSSVASHEFYNGGESQKHLEGGILAWEKEGLDTISLETK